MYYVLLDIDFIVIWWGYNKIFTYFRLFLCFRIHIEWVRSVEYHRYWMEGHQSDLLCRLASTYTTDTRGAGQVDQLESHLNTYRSPSLPDIVICLIVTHVVNVDDNESHRVPPLEQTVCQSVKWVLVSLVQKVHLVVFLMWTITSLFFFFSFFFI